MNETPYEQILITQYRLIVNYAPERSLMSVELLRDGKFMISAGDRIYLGLNETGDDVIYRIVGWDAEQKGLILERTQP